MTPNLVDEPQRTAARVFVLAYLPSFVLAYLPSFVLVAAVNFGILQL